MYADQKENFDTITYYFTLKKDKIYIKDIKLNEVIETPSEEENTQEETTEEPSEEKINEENQ